MEAAAAAAVAVAATNMEAWGKREQEREQAAGVG
jgi:hypothetical protein